MTLRDRFLHVGLMLVAVSVSALIGGDIRGFMCAWAAAWIFEFLRSHNGEALDAKGSQRE